jgi:hypothetical protein
MGRFLSPEKASSFARAPQRALFKLCGLVLMAGACSPPQSVDRAMATDDGGSPGPQEIPPAAPVGSEATPSRPAPPPPPPPTCGNGSLDPGEGCDLGAANNRVDAYGPGQCTSVCQKAPMCGDSMVSGAEECDDGSRNSESDSRYGTQGACNVLCQRVSLFCGDSAVTPPETCDRGTVNNMEGAYGPGLCTASCQIAPYCGDARSDMREECDEGPSNQPTDKIWTLQGGGCNMLCRKIIHRCGDGKTDMPDETCDAGPANTNNDMIYGTGPGCNRRCQKVSFCGDGFRDPVEHCDEGRRNVNTDKFWNVTQGGCNRDCFVIYRYCGDGFVEGAPDEECDLGPGRNTGGPGGCTATCKRVPP